MTDADVEAGLGAGADRSRAGSKGGRGGGPGSEFARLSRSGNSLYELLDIPKTSTDQEIKKKYRRLALKYHPDKNPDNADAEEMFKKINHANSILSDEKKRKIYDDYGSFGIYITDQMGSESEGVLKLMSMLNSIWCNILACFCFCLSGCCCCCCCLCCCFCCCGKCAPKDVEGDQPDWEDLQDGEDEEVVDKEPLNGSSRPENGGNVAGSGYGSTDDAPPKERTKTPPPASPATGGEEAVVTVESEK